MQGCSTVVKQTAKSGQSIGSVMRACKIWSLGKWEIEEIRAKRVRFGKGFKIVQGENKSRMRWLPPKNPLGRDERNKKRNCGDTGKGGTKWKMAAASLHNDVLLISKNVTRERPIALMPTLICWWEALRAPEVAKWQQKYRVDWDAAGGRNGGAQRTVWETLMEMEVQIPSRRGRSGSSGLGSGRGEGLRAGQSPCCVGMGDALQFPKEDFAGAMRAFRAPEAGAV